MLLWLESDRPCYKLSNHGLAFIVDISQSGCILDLMESGIWSMSGDQFHQYNKSNETIPYYLGYNGVGNMPVEKSHTKIHLQFLDL